MRDDTRRCQAENPLIVLSRFPEPALFISASPLTKQIATKLGKGTISNVSGATLGNIMVSGAPDDFVGNFTTSYMQTQVNNFHALQNFQAGVSTAMSAISPSLSLTIGIAEAAIGLAKAVIAAHTTSTSH
jgi:hypothetical protein